MQWLSPNYGSSGGSLVIYFGGFKHLERVWVIFLNNHYLSRILTDDWQQTNHCPLRGFSLASSTKISLLWQWKVHIPHTPFSFTWSPYTSPWSLYTHSREPSRLTLLSSLIWTHVTLQGKGEVISKALKKSKCQLLLLSKLHFGSHQLKPKGKSPTYQERCFVEHLFSSTSG